MKLKDASIDKIDLRALDYVFTYRPRVAEMVDSIKEHGILQPLVLLRKDRRYRIICGYRRALAARQAGLKVVPAWLCNEEEMPEQQRLMTSLHEDAHSRAYNDIEKAIVLNKFAQRLGWNSTRLAHEVAPIIRLPASPTVVERYLSLLRLDDEILRVVAAGTFSVDHALLLLAIPADDRLTVFRLLTVQTRASLNESREIIKNVRDIALLTNTSVREVLANEEIASILNDSSLGPRETLASLREAFHKKRHPTVAEYETKFAEAVAALGLSKSVAVSPPQSFEGSHVGFSFRASSKEELRKIIAQIQEKLATDGFDHLFDVFKL